MFDLVYQRFHLLGNKNQQLASFVHLKLASFLKTPTDKFVFADGW